MPKPAVRLCLVCLRNGKKDNVADMQGSEEGRKQEVGGAERVKYVKGKKRHKILIMMQVSHRDESTAYGIWSVIL